MGYLFPWDNRHRNTMWINCFFIILKRGIKRDTLSVTLHSANLKITDMYCISLQSTWVLNHLKSGNMEKWILWWTLVNIYLLVYSLYSSYRWWDLQQYIWRKKKQKRHRTYPLHPVKYLSWNIHSPPSCDYAVEERESSELLCLMILDFVFVNTLSVQLCVILPMSCLWDVQ